MKDKSKVLRNDMEISSRAWLVYILKVNSYLNLLGLAHDILIHDL